ncbi:DUF3667 domain-containing protein [Croceicoccus bisphenolivorans]|uniref:DUF3667 domain-containing protein n=1 Tax=Croceicoccus bisphenolivorans TaxID=1783232 RepID=UPI00083660FD|nr:DUF3667 domain-containing protein [Croceicoccus bisphenolivorans]
MTGEGIEALGGAVEGAALARAVEPAHGEGSHGGTGHFHEGACLNCAAPLAGNYCAHCGQPAHLHRTMGAFLHDLTHSVLHLEGKTWRTLPMLAFRPGRLTREYIDGKRARYVSPMALFLFAIFLMFAVFSFAAPKAPADIAGSQNAANLEQAITELQEKRTAAAEDLAALPANDPARAETETRIADIDDDLELMRSLTVGNIAETNLQDASRFAPLLRKWRENPSLMIYKLQSTGYKFSWLLIPLSLPFVWLIFAWKRQFGVYDHAVFVTYSIGFMSLLFIVASLLGMAGVGSSLITLAVIVIVPAHIFAQLRGGYALSGFGAAWRTAATLVIALIVMLLFLAILLAMGAMG